MADRILTCLTNLIGLTRSNCGCDNNSKPADAETSASGLYIDELENGPSLDAVKAAATDCAGMWDLMTNAKIQAIERVQDDVKTAVNTLYKNVLKPYRGNIGDSGATRSLSLTTVYGALRLNLAYLPDAEIAIKNIYLLFDSSFATTVKIMRHYDSSNMPPVQIGADRAVNVVANQATPVPGAALSLPFTDAANKPIRYSIVYTRPGAVQPLDNRLSCNCGLAEANMGAFLSPVGVQGNDLASLSQWQTSAYANGIFLDVDIRCNTDSLLCRAVQDNVEIFTTAAYAARYKAGELLFAKILGSTNANSYTMNSRDYMYGQRNHFLKMYNERIRFISEQIDLSGSGCFTCDEGNGPIKAGIIS